MTGVEGGNAIDVVEVGIAGEAIGERIELRECRSRFLGPDKLSGGADRGEIAVAWARPSGSGQLCDLLLLRRFRLLLERAIDRLEISHHDDAYLGGEIRAVIDGGDDERRRYVLAQ